jgi:hypothetical protein
VVRRPGLNELPRRTSTVAMVFGRLFDERRDTPAPVPGRIKKTITRTKWDSSNLRPAHAAQGAKISIGVHATLFRHSRIVTPKRCFPGAFFNQAFRFGPCAYGRQFHVEITGETVDDWQRIPAYRHALEATVDRAAAVVHLSTERSV